MDTANEFRLASSTDAQVYLITKGEGSHFSAYVLGNEIPEAAQEIGKKVWQVRVFTKEPKFDGVELRYNAPLGNAFMFLCEDGTLFSSGGRAPTEKTLKELYEEAKNPS